MLKSPLTKLNYFKDSKFVIVDSKYFYYQFSSKKNPNDKSFFPDVNAMRFCFESVVGIFSSIVGSLNSTDVVTKKDGLLTEILILTLATGKLQFYFLPVNEVAVINLLVKNC